MAGILFIVDGPSAAGKSHLMRFAERRFQGVRSIPKLTTRPRRPGEKTEAWSDLIHLDPAAFEAARPELQYAAMGHRYGIRLTDVVECLAVARASMIVIRDLPTARELAARLATVQVVPVFVLATEEVRRQRLERNGFNGGEVRLRLETDVNPLAQYDSNDDFYRERLDNNGTVEAYELLIEALFDRYLLG